MDRRFLSNESTQYQYQLLLGRLLEIALSLVMKAGAYKSGMQEQGIAYMFTPDIPVQCPRLHGLPMGNI